MEQGDNKRRTGQSVAFYAALAVCLIAAGVGTWQLLQPEKAASGTAAVSAPIGPDAPSASDAATVPDAASSSDAATASGASEETRQAVSGAAAVPDAATASDAPDAAQASDAAPSSGDAQAVSGAAKSKDTGGAKSGDTKSGGAKSGDAKSGGAKSGDTGSTKSGAKSGDTKSGGGKAESGKSASGDAVRPVEGAVVTSYSMDKLLYNETMRDWRTHDGIDIAADAGAAVVAARAGTVESVAADPIMGMTVTIRHEGAWETAYSSLSDAPEVEAGDEVAAGQVIGFVGDSAASEAALGPHLHFAVLKDGAPSDPEAFLS